MYDFLEMQTKGPFFAVYHSWKRKKLLKENLFHKWGVFSFVQLCIIQSINQSNKQKPLQLVSVTVMLEFGD